MSTGREVISNSIQEEYLNTITSELHLGQSGLENMPGISPSLRHFVGRKVKICEQGDALME